MCVYRGPTSRLPHIMKSSLLSQLPIRNVEKLTTKRFAPAKKVIPPLCCRFGSGGRSQSKSKVAPGIWWIFDDLVEVHRINGGSRCEIESKQVVSDI